MFGFEILEELVPNDELLGTIKNFNFTTKNGKVKHLLNTNLQFIELTEYLITYPVVLTIFKYKVNYIIDMIKDMDIENKLRLAICMCDNYSHTNLEYDKKEMCKYFDNLLREINIKYKTTTINFANYPYIIFASAKIMEMDFTEQNKVALYLFNTINLKIKKYKSIDNIEQMF